MILCFFKKKLILLLKYKIYGNNKNLKKNDFWIWNFKMFTKLRNLKISKLKFKKKYIRIIMNIEFR